ncbi:MAG: hypothetical protein FJ213_03190 [Ignavibacteria bacterium]|nr:hypothetical protein [Ignavibacteria bacterium]
MNKENNSEQQKRFEDFIIVLVKYRRIILWNTGIVTLLAVIISLLMPNWYTSTASILSPKKKSGLFGDIAGFSTAIKDISRTLGRLGTTSDEAFNYLAILQSRSSFEKVIRKFNIREVYDFSESAPIENVIGAFEDNVQFNVEDEGNITIKVSDKDPKRAADMANYFVQVLNDISIELGVAEARNNREFIEKRYEQLKVDLKNIEDSLKMFSEKYSVYAIDEQTKAAIQAAAEIKSLIMIEEIKLEVLRKTMDESSPEIQQAKLQIKEMNSKLNQMKFGREKLNKESLSLFVPFGDIPEVGIQYLRLKRDFEIQTKLMEFLLPIFEQSKIEEQKNIPVVLVLDVAVPAEKKSSPKRSIIVLASFLISFFLSICFVLIKNSFVEIKNEHSRYKKLREEIFLPMQRMFAFRKK